MNAPVWSQIDAGVALALGALVATAAVRKFQRPAVFALTLQRLDSALTGRRALATRLTLVVATYELVVGFGVVVFRGLLGFAFACGLLVACVGFLLALGRAVQQSIPCGCFGRLGRTAAGGREIGRAVALTVGAAFLVGQRAVNGDPSHGFGPIAIVAVLGTALLIVGAQRIGARIRPGVELAPADERDPGGALVRSLRSLTGYDNELYSSGK
jgi:hypothetical protein